MPFTGENGSRYSATGFGGGMCATVLLVPFSNSATTRRDADRCACGATKRARYC